MSLGWKSGCIRPSVLQPPRPAVCCCYLHTRILNGTRQGRKWKLPILDKRNNLPYNERCQQVNTHDSAERPDREFV